jgi:CRP-like cAMP-binding protein
VTLELPPQSFLAQIPPLEREALRTAAIVRRLADGEHLMREGEAPASVGIVLRGVVKLTKTALTGRVVLLDLRGPGDVLGDLGAIDDRPRSASAVALGEVESLMVPVDQFRRLLVERPAISQALLVTLAQRLRDSSTRQLELGAIDVVGRVCQRVLELAASHGEATNDGVLIRDAISQQELAEWSGVSRDGVVRALQELRRAGAVETGRQRVLVRDLSLLRGRAGA